MTKDGRVNPSLRASQVTDLRESGRPSTLGLRFVVVACSSLDAPELAEWLELLDVRDSVAWLVVPERDAASGWSPELAFANAPSTLKFLRDGSSPSAGEVWVLPYGERASWIAGSIRWQLPLRGPGTPPPSEQLADSLKSDPTIAHGVSIVTLTAKQIDPPSALSQDPRVPWALVDSNGRVLSAAPIAGALTIVCEKGERRVHAELEAPLRAAISSISADGTPVNVPSRPIHVGCRTAQIGFALSALGRASFTADVKSPSPQAYLVSFHSPDPWEAELSPPIEYRGGEIESFYDSAPVGLAALDSNFRYLRINDRLARMNGIPAQDHIGQTIHEILGDSAVSIEASMRPVIERGVAIRDLESRGRTRADTTLRDWLLQYTPIHGAQGEVTGINVVVQDVTDQKEASRRVAAEHAITHLLADEISSEALFPEILEALCHALEIEMGEVWLYEEAIEQVAPCDFYSGSDDEAARNFQAAIPDDPAARIGCPARRAWRSGQAEVFQAVDSDTEFPRRELAAACGLQVAMAFPLLGEDLPYGAIALYAERPFVDESALRDSLETIGRDIGRFIRRERIELALRASEEELRHVTDSIPMRISLVDREGRYQFTNEEYVRSFGFSKAELQGRLVRDVVGETAYAQIEPMIRRALAGAQVEYEVDVTNANGPPSTLAVKYQPRIEADGVVSGFYALVVDVTQRAKAEQESRHRANCLEEIRRVNLELTGELDLARLERSVTEAAVKISGAEAGAFVHRIVDESRLRAAVYSTVANPASRELLSSQADYALRGPTLGSKSSVRIADLRENPEFAGALRLFAFPIDTAPIRSYLAAPVLDRQGAPVGSIMLTHSNPGAFSRNAEDIVGGIALQVGIALENASLYETIRAREQSSRFQARQLEIMDRRKDEFLAILGHELRNPLMALDVGMRVLRQEGVEPSELAWTHQMLERQAAQLTGLVDDLLDATRISRGKVRLKKKSVELSEVIEASVTTVDALAQSKGQRIQVAGTDCDTRIHGDRVRLEQVITNLLTNAVKYSGEGTVIRLSVELCCRDQVRISVADQGVGLPQESLERIFEPFTQRDVSTEGLGIGLSLVRQLVALHGGRSYAKSPGPGAGSTFTIELPTEAFAERETPQEETVGEKDRSSASDTSVLLISHTGDSSGETAEALRKHDCRVVAIREEDLEGIAEEFRPQIVIVELQGLESSSDLLAGKVRKLPACHGAMIVALRHAFVSQDPERSLDRVAFDEIWTEPVPVETMTGAVDRCISKLARSHGIETLLLVEDNVDSARGMCLLLREEENRRVVLAGTIAEALVAFEKHRPQIVLSDIGLPDGSGYDLARTLRGHGDSRLLMIAISGHAGEIDRRRSLEAGFDEHLPKPIDFNKLYELIKNRRT